MIKRNIKNFGQTKKEQGFYNASITVGLEFEVHRTEPLIQRRGKKIEESKEVGGYKEQLKSTKIARVINDLRVQDFFPDLAKQTSYLCLIKLNEKPFMEVVFDDNNEMSRLEFISVLVGSGILPYNVFFAKENLQNTKQAVEIFPVAIKQMQKEETNFAEVKNFSYEVPSYAGPIIFEKKLTNDPLKYSGAIHVTHTYPISLLQSDTKADGNLIEATNKGSSRKNFLEDLNSQTLSTGI